MDIEEMDPVGRTNMNRGTGIASLLQFTNISSCHDSANGIYSGTLNTNIIDV